MTKYVLTSPRLKGQVTFGYDADGNIVYYHNEVDDPAAVLWLKRFLPLDHSELEFIKTKIAGTIKEIPEDLTFERFWNAYDKKINRKRAEPLFEKLNDAQKMQAIVCIKAYQEYCAWKHRGIADPEKYLRDGFFETDWLKLK